MASDPRWNPLGAYQNDAGYRTCAEHCKAVCMEMDDCVGLTYSRRNGAYNSWFVGMCQLVVKSGTWRALMARGPGPEMSKFGSLTGSVQPRTCNACQPANAWAFCDQAATTATITANGGDGTVPNADDRYLAWVKT